MWNKADLHIHTTYSDGLMDPAENVDYIARHTPLKVIAITDHDTAAGAFVAQEYARRHAPQLEVVIGQEVSTGDGELLGLFLQSNLPVFRTAAEAIGAIHRQGGLAVAVHPFTPGKSLGAAILHLPLDAVETRHGSPASLIGNLLTLIFNHYGPKLPQMGSSDSHIPYSAGHAFTWFPGSTSADLRRAIETGAIRPGGPYMWKFSAMLRKVPVLLQRGWPRYIPQKIPQV
ncbi:MAG: PHP domain-containing protein [Anaerolineae bacterium]|nr:PHP domain-containing protein [Anaerolineae bacterium]